MTSIQLWGDAAERYKDEILKNLKMKWSRKRRRFVRERCDRRVLKKIMNFCLERKINYKTDDGQSFEVIPSEAIEPPIADLRARIPDVSRGQAAIEEIDYEQMWEEYKEEE
ncbi:MAG: hypothetical protein PHN82_01335 [bacterium]|nr:hypothetical protein [bacterium]